MVDEKKSLTLGEKLINYGKAAGLFATALVALYGAFYKGEPVAKQAQQDVNQAWEKIKEKVGEQNAIINKQSSMVERLARRMVHMQGVQEGFRSGKLYEQLQQLKARQGRVVVKQMQRRPAEPAPPAAQQVLPKATPMPKNLRKAE